MMQHLNQNERCEYNIQVAARTDKGDSHERDPQPAVESHYALFPVHLEREPRDRDLVARSLQPRLDGVQLSPPAI